MTAQEEYRNDDKKPYRSYKAMLRACNYAGVLKFTTCSDIGPLDGATDDSTRRRTKVFCTPRFRANRNPKHREAWNLKGKLNDN